MNCDEFDERLAASLLPALPDEARRHASDCARCAARLHAAVSLDRALAGAFDARVAPADAAFTDGVMARLAETPRLRPSGVEAVPASAAFALPRVPFAAALVLVVTGMALAASPGAVGRLGRAIEAPAARAFAAISRPEAASATLLAVTALFAVLACVGAYWLGQRIADGGTERA